MAYLKPKLEFNLFYQYSDEWLIEAEALGIILMRLD